MSIKIIRCADSHVVNVVNTSTGDILTASIVKSLIKDGKSLVHMIINTTKQGLPVFSMEHKFATMNATKVAVTCDLVGDEDLPIDIHFIVEGYQSTASYSFRNDAARSRGFNSTGAITYQDFIKEFIEDTSDCVVSGGIGNKIVGTVPAKGFPTTISVNGPVPDMKYATPVSND